MNDDQAKLGQRLRELPTVAAPPELQSRVMDSLQAAAEPAAVVDLRSRRPWFGSSAARAGLALAACSAMLFLWFFWLGERPPVDPQAQPQFAVQPPPDTGADELARLQAASADLEQVLLSEPASPIYGDDQAWVEHSLQLALHQVDADLAAQPGEEEKLQLWTQRVALLAGLAEQSLGPPLGSGVEWVQLN